MIRAAIAGAAVLAAAPALGAGGGPILGGEHVGFSRVVLEIDPGTEWSLETAPGRAIVVFPGRSLAFATGGTFEKLPRTRIRAVRPVAGAGGTTVAIDISCECLVSALAVGTRYIALDVADAGVVPEGVEAAAQHALGRAAHAAEPRPAETTATRAEREAAAVASAEAILIRQIERAASQGLIELSGAAPAPELAPPSDPAAEPPASPPAPAASGAPLLPVRGEPAAAAEAGEIARLLDHEQIRAITVFDRDRRTTARGSPDPGPASECLPDAAFDVAAWSNGLPMHRQAADLSRSLVGEFDAPDPVAIAALARLDIRFGFGAEALSLLAGFDVPLEERALLADLARAADGMPAAAGGPLAVSTACPGRHGLWLALGGVAPVFHDEGHFATVQAAFAELPPDMRALHGPPLIGRLLDAGEPGAARLIWDTAARPGAEPAEPMRLAEARLEAAEGRPLEAVQALAGLVEAGAPNRVEALIHLVRLALDEGVAVPERSVTDLRAAAVELRGSPHETPLRRLLAEALAARGSLAPAIAEIRSARADLPADAASIEALAVRLLAAADPAAVGPATYADAMLAAADLVSPARANDPARRAIGRQLAALGLANAALAVLAPATVRGDAAALLIAADAELRLGHPAMARAALAGLDGPDAAALRARSFALAGDFHEAASTLAGEGLDDGPYAWPAGDWPQVREAEVPPARAAMAAWMADRASGAGPAPSPDPAALTPEAAFREPVPSLADPSLDAARRLLAAGRQLEGFVQGVLAED